MALNCDNNLNVRFRNALNLLSLRLKIYEISAILEQCTLRELQVFFPQLVENIFGISPGLAGWNLKRINSIDSKDDFDAAVRFLNPLGTLFDVAYKLLGDVYCKYNYNIAYLPSNFRTLMEQGNIPSFFMDKVEIDPISREPFSLNLNSFELYIFHFMYHLVSPWHQPMDGARGKTGETAYRNLSLQYISHFLPVNTSTVLPVVEINHLTPRSPPPQMAPVRMSNLFKPSAIKQMMAAMTVASQPHAEVWRSEMLLLLVIYFWLYAPETSQKPQQSPSRIPTQNISLFGLEGLNGRASGDHLRVVRNMIKHVHYFANNIRNDGTAMDEIRRSIRSVLRGPVHAFLKHNIHHWPLDSSFMLMLETYLSYIQPWRYQKYNPGSNLGQSTDVDATWCSFIAENFEIYSQVIVQLISRFSRMDLSSIRHAEMLFRLTKVLSTPGLVTLLYDCDRNNQIRGDCDGTTALFTESSRKKVTELLHKIQAIISLLHQQEQTPRKKSLTFLQSIQDWFIGQPYEEYSTSDCQATLYYLENGIGWLSTIFGVEPPDPPADHESSKVQPSLLDPVLAQKRAAFIKYGGNPDLLPIRSDEFAPLVRALHRISKAANEIHGTQIAELWYRQDLVGQLSRQFLTGPCQTYHFHKTAPGNPAPLVVAMLPPRVCLRRLASYRVILFFALLASLPHIFGWSPPLAYLVFLLVYGVFLVVKVKLLPYFNRDPGQEEIEPFVPQDISFNE